MRTLILTIAACAALGLAACGNDDSSADSTEAAGSAAVESSGDASNRSKPEVTVPDGAPPMQLERTDLIEGTGPEAESGDEVTVQAGEQGIRFLLVSGKPIEEPVAWYGPIVMNTEDELRQAVAEMRAGTFIKHGK